MQADIQIPETAVSGTGVLPQDQHCWNEAPSISAAGACDSSFLQEPHNGEWASEVSNYNSLAMQHILHDAVL